MTRVHPICFHHLNIGDLFFACGRMDDGEEVIDEGMGMCRKLSNNFTGIPNAENLSRIGIVVPEHGAVVHAFPPSIRKEDL